MQETFLPAAMCIRHLHPLLAALASDPVVVALLIKERFSFVAEGVDMVAFRL